MTIDPSVWMFVFFIVFFVLGYESEKASGGFFMLFAGFALIGCGGLLHTTLIYINIMTVPFGIFICFLGIIKAFFTVTEEEEKTSSGGSVRKRRIRRR